MPFFLWHQKSLMEINNEIISFLFAVGKVNIPGLGLLEINKSSSFINPTKTKLFSPKYSAKFHENKFDEEIHSRFVEYLANKYTKSKSFCNDKIQKHSVQLLNNIVNFGSAELENLGTISVEGKNKVFELTPFLKEVLDKSYSDLPLVYVSRKNKIESEDKKNQHNIIATYEQPQEKRERKGWLIPLLVLTLISVLFVYLLYCLFDVIDSDKSDNKLIYTTQNNVVIQNDSFRKKVDIENTEKNLEKDIFKQNAAKENRNDNDVKEEIKKDSQAIENNQKIKVKNQESIDDKSRKDNSNVLDVSNGYGSRQKDKLDKVNLSDLLNFGPELLSQYDKSCIIIVGSFVKKSNASKMLNKMYNAGFSPYAERYGKFHRTGVIFDCNERPLYQFLQDLRKTIDKDSWILKYK